MGKHCQTPKTELVPDQQTLSFCNWDCFFVWNMSQLKKFKRCRFDLRTNFRTKERLTTQLKFPNFYVWFFESWFHIPFKLFLTFEVCETGSIEVLKRILFMFRNAPGRQLDTVFRFDLLSLAYAEAEKMAFLSMPPSSSIKVGETEEFESLS